MRFKALAVLLIIAGTSLTALAQDEGAFEDNYDPFADYSEFTEATSEETDINFFNHGRMLSIAGGIGIHTLTGEMSKYYTRDPMFGLYFSYFYSLRFAVQVNFNTTTHHLEVPDHGQTIRARVRLNTFGAHAKYFLNTQNMTRAFGDLNPYILGGFSQIMRNTSTNYNVLTGSDGALGFDAGFGIEYMFNRRKNFVGLMVMYQYADFPNEKNAVPSGVQTNQSTGVKLSGDILVGLLTIGVNF